MNEKRESWKEILLPAVLVVGLFLVLNLSASGEIGTEEHSTLETWLKLIVNYLVLATEIAAALVIGAAVVRAILSYVRYMFVHPEPNPELYETIRLRLGRMLVLGLEFTLASDILGTAVAPTRQDIITLTAIVLLRTLLNHFLEREVNEAEEKAQKRIEAKQETAA